MKESGNQYERLAVRDDFNASVRHIKASIAVIDRFERKENLADVLNEMLESGEIQRDDLQSIVSIVLAQKYPYAAVSANLSGTLENPAALAKEVGRWNGVDLVIVYHHPELGTLVVNPKNESQASTIDSFSRNECVTVWAGAFKKELDRKRLESAAGAVIRLLEGKAAKAEASFLKGECAYRARKAPKAPKERAPKAPKRAPAAGFKAGAVPAAPEFQPSAPASQAPATNETAVASGAMKMTPSIGVPVTNELFHNGNVEAWKRIIESFTTKHPGLQVFVYYDGERITNLNSLFTWGKVKRGTCIEFKVAGENIVDVAKLHRYLKQGASPMFEAFLKFPVNTILPLF